MEEREQHRPPGKITSNEAAEILGVRRSYVYQLSDRGALTFIMMGFTRWYDREEVLAYKKSHPNLGKRNSAA